VLAEKLGLQNRSKNHPQEILIEVERRVNDNDNNLEKLVTQPADDAEKLGIQPEGKNNLQKKDLNEAEKSPNEPDDNVGELVIQPEPKKQLPDNVNDIEDDPEMVVIQCESKLENLNEVEKSLNELDDNVGELVIQPEFKNQLPNNENDDEDDDPEMVIIQPESKSDLFENLNEIENSTNELDDNMGELAVQPESKNKLPENQNDDGDTAEKLEMQSESKNDLIDNLSDVENSANELDGNVGELAVQPESKHQLPENQNDDDDAEKLEIQSESKNYLVIDHLSEVENSANELDDKVGGIAVQLESKNKLPENQNDDDDDTEKFEIQSESKNDLLIDNLNEVEKSPYEHDDNMVKQVIQSESNNDLLKNLSEAEKGLNELLDNVGGLVIQPESKVQLPEEQNDAENLEIQSESKNDLLIDNLSEVENCAIELNDNVGELAIQPESKNQSPENRNDDEDAEKLEIQSESKIEQLIDNLFDVEKSPKELDDNVGELAVQLESKNQLIEDQNIAIDAEKLEIQSESKNDLLIDNLCEVENSANELDDCVGDLAIQPESKNQLPENQNDDEDAEKLEIQSESKIELLIDNLCEVEKSPNERVDNVGELAVQPESKNQLPENQNDDDKAVKLEIQSESKNDLLENLSEVEKSPNELHDNVGELDELPEIQNDDAESEKLVIQSVFKNDLHIDNLSEVEICANELDDNEGELAIQPESQNPLSENQNYDDAEKLEIQSESRNDLLIDNLSEVENCANELDGNVGEHAVQPESKNQLPENQNDDEDSEKLEIQSESKNDLLIENQSEVEKSCYDLDDNVENPEKLLEVGRGPNDLLDNLENTKLKSEEEEKGEELASSLN